MEKISENRCFGGVQGVYRHRSSACRCDMTFGLFLPQEAEHAAVPVIWYLSGLTCTHENAMVKAGLQQWAAAEGVAVIFPDTSPRGRGLGSMLTRPRLLGRQTIRCGITWLMSCRRS